MSHRAAALVVGLAAAAWVASRGLAPVLAPGSYPGYTPADPLIAQLIEPVLHAPWVGAVAWPFAALLAVSLVCEAWLLSVLYGASPIAAAVVVVATAASLPWTVSVRHGGALAMAVAWSWLAWWFLGHRSGFREGGRSRRSEPDGRESGSPRETGPARSAGWRLTAIGLFSWIAAIAASWLALIVAPMVLASLTIGEQRKRVRLGLVLVGVLAGVAGLALYCWRIADLVTALSATALPVVTPIDVLGLLFDPTPRPQLSAGADLGLASILTIALATLGAAGATARRRWRGSVVIAAAAAALIATGWPMWRVAVCQLAVWLASPFVAVGVTVLMRTIAPQRQTWATVVAGAMLFAATVGDRASFQATPEASPRSAPPALLGSLAVDSALFVAEDLDVDAAVVAMQGAAREGWRVVQEPAYVAELADAGRTVVAGPVARRHLELAGFRFQPLIAPQDGSPSRRPHDPLPLARVVGQLHCAVVRSDRWSLLPGLEYTGRLGVEIPGGRGGAMMLVVGDDARPPVVVTSVDGDVQPVAIEPLLTAPAVDTPPPDYWFDGGDPARAPSSVVRVRVPSHPVAVTLRDVALGRRAPRVLARLTGLDSGARGRVCASPLAAPELWSDPRAPREAVVPLDSAAMFTAGWYGVEGVASERYRWTDSAAVVLLSSARRGAVRIAIEAEPPESPSSRARSLDDLSSMSLRVNGVESPGYMMRSKRHRYEWSVPARTWLSGTNELVFFVSRTVRPADVGERDPRTLGMKVWSLTVTRME